MSPMNIKPPVDSYKNLANVSNIMAAVDQLKWGNIVYALNRSKNWDKLLDVIHDQIIPYVR